MFRNSHLFLCVPLYTYVTLLFSQFLCVYFLILISVSMLQTLFPPTCVLSYCKMWHFFVLYKWAKLPNFLQIFSYPCQTAYSTLLRIIVVLSPECMRVRTAFVSLLTLSRESSAFRWYYFPCTAFAFTQLVTVPPPHSLYFSKHTEYNLMCVTSLL